MSSLPCRWSRRRWLTTTGIAALGLGGPTTRAATGSREYGRGLLWRIERPGIAPSHLFGTVHLDDPRLLDFRPAVRTALHDAEVMLTEFLADAQSASTFQRAMHLEGAETLRAVAGEAVFERAAALLASRYGMPPRVVDRLKPWAAYLALSRPMRPARGEIVDAALRRLAEDRALEIAPLESIEAQIAAMDAVPRASQVALLDRLTRHHDAAMADVERLVDLYLTEDLAGMRRQQERAVGREPALRSALNDFLEQVLWRRNDHMLDRLRPRIAAGGAFAAMGALHLEGRRGLPARLAREGWTLRPVTG